jgi:very-short-patch-repair endonuclease
MSSDAERAMLTMLKWAGLPEPMTEYRFHPSRKWRFDFAWEAPKVALEVEGGTWISGAHTRGRHFESDAEKYNEAALAGWKVLRVTTQMVDDGRAIAFIERALR